MTDTAREESPRWPSWRAVLTGLILLLNVGVIWWLLGHGADIPPRDEDGDVLVDAFKNGTAVFTVTFAAFTTSLGFWFGSSGTDKAEKKADQADEKKEQAEQATRVAEAANAVNFARVNALVATPQGQEAKDSSVRGNPSLWDF